MMVYQLNEEVGRLLSSYISRLENSVQRIEHYSLPATFYPLHASLYPLIRDGKIAASDCMVEYSIDSKPDIGTFSEMSSKGEDLLKESKILVTGGSGFIGSHLVNRLIKERCRQIIVFDRYIRPDKFPSAGGLKIIQGEITQIERLKEIMPGVDYIFHLAVLPLGACTENPRACLETNINGTFNLIEAAKEANVKKIVFSSASSVYGDTEQTMDESHPLNARTMYGASKIAGEYFLRAFYDIYGLDYVILRYMNVYGPGQEGGLIVNVLKRIKDGLPPIIYGYGDGSQSFDFVYVDDVVTANILATGMRQLIPQEILEGEKQGFSVPDASWFRSESIEYVKQFLLEPKARIYDCLNPDYIQKRLEEHISGRFNHRLFIWSLLSFEWWNKIFMEKQYWRYCKKVTH